MVEIEGHDFTLFWDIDRSTIGGASFAARVEWLRQRINEMLLKPLAVLESQQATAYPWLVVTELVCAGIEALGGFYGDRMHGKGSPFCRFVYAFMHGDFSKLALTKAGESRTYCEHLQQYFRNALDHGFSLEWGGLWFADEPGFAGGYLRPNKGGQGIAICPRVLLADFRQAVEAYFARLSREGEHSLIGENFSDRFDAIVKQKGQTRH